MSEPISTILAGFVGGITSQVFSFIFRIFDESRAGRKNDTRTIINEAHSKIIDVSNAAEIVWNATGGDEPRKQLETVCLIQELSDLVAYVWELRPAHKDGLMRSLTEFHRVVTGDDFDSMGRNARPEKAITIRSRASALTMNLMRVRRRL